MSSSRVRDEQREAFQRFLGSPASPLKQSAANIGMPETWFLGPKAENEDVLLSIVVQAVAQHCAFRRRFHPADPAHVTDEIRQSQDYRDAIVKFNDLARTLFELLRHSVPFSSMRYQSHMLWDQALPAVAGYIGALLYNQNNVAAEASPVTTMLEIEVGNELCQMLGFAAPPSSEVTPWGHITCDGSVANIESLWAARNAKFFAVALRQALLHVDALKPARDLKVRTLNDGCQKLVSIRDPWILINLPIDSVVNLPQTLKDEFGIDVSVTTRALSTFAVQNIGLVEFYRKFLPDCAAPVVFAPATRHYSWPKAATLLGLGQNSIQSVGVDLDARMDIDQLEQHLITCKRQQQPVIAVVAVIGSTEESAVDPLRRILDLRRRFRLGGLDFAIHCDAAWGGYFNTIRIPALTPRSPISTGDVVPGSLLDQRRQFLNRLEQEQSKIPSLPLSDYVNEQYEALQHADSITVDPHKAGYAPYPAGSVCYRNSAMRDLISLKAPVIFHSEMEPTVGIYGVEGSKPGAAAAAVWLSQKVIPLSQRGYGQILGQCMWTSKRMYCRLRTMARRDPDPNRRYALTLFQRLPTERDGKSSADIEREEIYIANNFVSPTNAALLDLLATDAKARSLFSELGSDQVILAYSFNFKRRDGEWNRDPAKLAQLNNEIFKLCSIMDPAQDINSIPLILTSSDFDVASYGETFVRNYCSRLEIEFSLDVPIPFLISTTMDPWTTDTERGDFLEVIENALRYVVGQAIAIVDP
jgi:glutamate/tyrosine decarboxylase-like PLP-dependent enzyme